MWRFKFRAGLLLLAALLLPLSACGGGSTSESPTGSPGDEYPDGRPEAPDGGSTPGDGSQTPPDDGPPIVDPPDDDPPDDDPPDDPPIDPPPPPDDLLCVEDFEDVYAVAGHPGGRAWYGIRASTGDLFVLTPDLQQPELAGPTGLQDVHGLAFDPGIDSLYATVITPGTVDTDLYRIRLSDRSTERLGPLSGRGAVEGLAFRPSDGALFGVDAGKRLLRIDPATFDIVDVGPLGADVGLPHGLAYDPDEDVLYGADGEHGMLLAIDTVTGAARATVAIDPAVSDGLGFESTERLFLGAGAAARKLCVLDPMGSRFAWSAIDGLAHDPASQTLYGSHVANGVLLRIDPVSGWRTVVGYMPIPRLEGLAYAGDEQPPRLYGLSSATHVLYRIDPADASYVEVGRVAEVSAVPAWQQLAGLAAGNGALYASDGGANVIVNIDRGTAQAVLVAATPNFPGIHGLAMEAGTSRLHAFSNDTNSHVVYDLLNPGPPEVVAVDQREDIGGLAWIAGEERLLGTERIDDALVEVWRKEVAPQPGEFDEIAALARVDVDRLVGFDLSGSRFLHLQLPFTEALPALEFPDRKVEAMAYDTERLLLYAADNQTGTLWAVNADNVVTAVGAEGGLQLQGRVLKAMAYDQARQTLFAVDATSQELVVVDRDNGEVHPFDPALPGLPWSTIEAMTYDPDADLLLAVDRSSRALIDIDPDTGAAAAIPGVALDFENVSAAVYIPGTFELIVSDVEEDVLAVVHRATGQTVAPYAPLARHRGLGDVKPIGWWPRNAYRLDRLATCALQVGEAYDGTAKLVFRCGDEVLSEEPFDPDSMVTVCAIPPKVREGLKAGDTLTWGLVGPDGVDLTTNVQIVERPEVDKVLAALAGNEYLKKHSSIVREALGAHALVAHELPGEALERYVALAAEHADSPVVTRGVVTALRALELPEDRFTDALQVARALRSAHEETAEKDG